LEKKEKKLEKVSRISDYTPRKTQSICASKSNSNLADLNTFTRTPVKTSPSTPVRCMSLSRGKKILQMSKLRRQSEEAIRSDSSFLSSRKNCLTPDLPPNKSNIMIQSHQYEDLATILHNFPHPERMDASEEVSYSSCIESEDESKQHDDGNRSQHINLSELWRPLTEENDSEPERKRDFSSEIQLEFSSQHEPRRLPVYSKPRVRKNYQKLQKTEYERVKSLVKESNQKGKVPVLFVPDSLIEQIRSRSSYIHYRYNKSANVKILNMPVPTRKRSKSLTSTPEFEGFSPMRDDNSHELSRSASPCSSSSEKDNSKRRRLNLDVGSDMNNLIKDLVNETKQC